MADSITAAFDGSTVDGFRPGKWEPADVDPFDRMLLTADGTVTTLLEACTGEPVVTGTTRQAGPATLELLAATEHWWQPDAQLLELAPTERLIARRVTLRGGRSGVAYVLADSLVAPDRLPDALGTRLLRAGASLGRLLAARQLETRREILDIVAVRAGDAGDHLGVRPSTKVIRRSYTIVIDRRTVAAVTEWLPPGRLAAQTPTSNTTRTVAWQAIPRARSGLPHVRGGCEFVADL